MLLQHKWRPDRWFQPGWIVRTSGPAEGLIAQMCSARPDKRGSHLAVSDFYSARPWRFECVVVVVSDSALWGLEFNGVQLQTYA